ncbi:MAG: zinc-binding alcohol dehydrogenase [Chloroflexi bacterium]|nr:zinc-binding alcohol dehydrogenase [Chloroflexota bacterium]
MKRLVITGPRQASFDDVDIPECPPDGLLVRANVTAVSTGTEIRVYRFIPVDEDGEWLHGGVRFPDGPIENGYSMVGEVVEVGSDVADFNVGDRVFCAGTHKEYAVSPACDTIKLPNEVTDEQGVFLNILGVGQLGLRHGEPQPGENVAIVGLGVIGLSTLAFCSAFGFRTIGIDYSQIRRDVADTIGADLVLDPADDGLTQQVIDFFDGRGADLVLETASVWPAIKTSLEIVRQDGNVVVVARHTDSPTFNLVGHPYMTTRYTLRASLGYRANELRWNRMNSMKLTARLIANGTLPVDPMITHEFNWQDLPTVYHRLDQGDSNILGAVIRWR